MACPLVLTAAVMWVVRKAALKVEKKGVRRVASKVERSGFSRVDP